MCEGCAAFTITSACECTCSPRTSTVSTYAPGATPVSVYSPFGPLVASYTLVLAAFLARTTAAGNVAPEGSNRVPVIIPAPLCADAAPASHSTRASRMPISCGRITCPLITYQPGVRRPDYFRRRY